MDALLKANRTLCESRSPVGVREVCEMAAPIKALPGSVAKENAVAFAAIEAAGKAGGNPTYRAKIFHVDKINQNRRVYPREVMEANIDRMRKLGLLEKGNFTGAVDHLGYFDGGNLKDSCIIWRDITIEDDGSAVATYEIVRAHSKGADLIAQHEAGMAIGFSTYGMGTAHEPSEIESEKYGDSRGDFVVMDANYVLKKCDAVDDPSVHDAFKLDSVQVPGARRQAETNNGAPNGGAQEIPMKTLKEMQEKTPELFALHTAAIESAKTEGKTEGTNAAKAAAEQAQKDAIEAAVKPLREGLNALLPALAKIEGLNLPQKEITPAEAQTKIDALNTKLNEANTAKAASEARANELQTKVAAAEAATKDAERRTKVEAKLATVAKGSPYLKALKEAIADRIGDANFTEASVEAFVTTMTKAFKAAGLQGAAQPEGGADTQGEDVDQDEDDDTQSEGSTQDEDDVRESGDIPLPAELQKYNREVAARKAERSKK